MRLTLLLLTPLLLALPGHSGAGEQDRPPASRALHELFERTWEIELQESPVRASLLGDRRWNDRWPEMGVEAIQRRFQHAGRTLEALREIDRAALPAEDQLNYDLFERQYADTVEAHQHRQPLMAFDQRSGLHTSHTLVNTLRFEIEADYRDWIGRLRAFPAYVDGSMAVLREAVRQRVVQPEVIVRRVLGQLDQQIVEDPAASPYYTPFRRMTGLSEAAREDLARQAGEAIEADVVPALRRYREFLAGEYLPVAFEQVGIWQVGGGEEAYAFLTRSFTTTDLSPREIHDLGLSEVRRIRGEMQRIIDQVGFEGTFDEFFRFLRTDRQFYYDSPDALLKGYRALTRRIDPELVRVFRILPRMPYGVEPIPDLTAPDTTTAYYSQPAADGSRAGTYYVNLYRPEVRPTFEMMALSLHEGVPGHHLQIALAMELDLPAFRRHGGYTAFVEGWALYAESLGEEMGLYEDPYSKFGQLTYEMWRAVRLVVDTGMHAFRWDRRTAIDFFMANAPKSEADIVNEIDRYIGWPGQALAYKIGELKIKELRARAEEAFGERFDLREFHDVVLRNGAVTLDVLERFVDAWIAE
jgi:uncharacterized protein (DUF885 family)